MDASSFGAAVTIDQLDRDPHPLLARLRAREPISWIPALGGWLVSRYDLAVEVMLDAARFTVDDPRFSTAQVIGPSMLSLDGDEHDRHRAPFVAPFRLAAVRERFAAPVAQVAEELAAALKPTGAGELRRSFAGPLAAMIVSRALGLDPRESSDVLTWYDAIVAAVTEITAVGKLPAAGKLAFEALSERLHAVLCDARADSLLAAVAADSGLSDAEIIANAAVLLFGGIETTEAMIANAALHVLANPGVLARLRARAERLDAAIDESLRLEPAAAVIDRYATANIELGGARIVRGDLVRISIAAANRDPHVFAEPDRFDLDRPSPRRHLAFAHGPHVCVGLHLARLEARTALATLLEALPGLRLDPTRPPAVSGLVFRKPQRLNVLWDS